MCLAVPGKILTIDDSAPLTRAGEVDFGGIRQRISLVFVPEAEIGDYILAHAGFAISRLDAEQARATLIDLGAA